MISTGRIGAIYRKELLEILRDRRTLTAMVVIPVVLYPLLMLGFLRAAESEQAKVVSQRFVVVVPNEQAAMNLSEMLAFAERAAGQSATSMPTSQPANGKSSGRSSFDLRIGQLAPGALGDDIQLIARLTPRHLEGHDRPAGYDVELSYNETNIHSRTAMEQFSERLRSASAEVTQQRVTGLLEESGVEVGRQQEMELILNPIRVRAISASTEPQRGGWALGQIIPIILVLMTITGSVYPAIDLTAGERERGTLETLMVTPVPALHLIMGKFLVVATVGMITAVLNVASVGATMHFSGLTRAITEELPVQIPLTTLPIILLTMVPFSLLFAAILIAVCSFARTFKEAQSYVMPVILGALIPAMAATLPTVRLSGITLVLPVGNMVLLARELFQDTARPAQIIVVLLSTSLYAGAAVAVAVRLFGQEAVVFADSGSYKTLFLRRFYRPVPLPTMSQALLMVALLFPLSFYAQSLLGSASPDNFLRVLKWLAVVQFAGLFVLVPVGLAAYSRIDVRETFRLRMPPARAWLAAALIGVSSWAIAHEFVGLQARLIPPSPSFMEAMKQLQSQLDAAPVWQLVLLLAVIPGLCEELVFRGFLLSGLRSGTGKWTAILLCGLVFGVFHFMVDRMPVTGALGIVLAWMVWNSGSIWPAVVMHILHNGLLMSLLAGWPALEAKLGLSGSSPGLLPARTLIPALIAFALGLVVIRSMGRSALRPSSS